MMFPTMTNLGIVLNVGKNIVVSSSSYQEAFLSRKWLQNIRQSKSDQVQHVTLVCALSMFVR